MKSILLVVIILLCFAQSSSKVYNRVLFVRVILSHRPVVRSTPPEILSEMELLSHLLIAPRILDLQHFSDFSKSQTHAHSTNINLVFSYLCGEWSLFYPGFSAVTNTRFVKYTSTLVICTIWAQSITLSF